MAQRQTRSTYARGDLGVANEDKIASLFQPDTLAVAQYFGNLRRHALLEPEKRLAYAILEDAIRTYQDNASAQHKRGKRLFQETEEWITLTGRDWIFSFENVCETLGLDAGYVRQGLLRWKEQNRFRPHRGHWQNQNLAS